MTPLRLQSTDAFIPSISWVICMLHVIIPVEELTCEELEAQRSERTCPRLQFVSGEAEMLAWVCLPSELCRSQL